MSYHLPNLFSLSITQKEHLSDIEMALFCPFLNTNTLPYTFSILKSELPTIFNSTCYNEKNLPFRKEVLNTEVGHLYEHILLEYLCKLKLLRGVRNATFKGVTDWNWNKEQKGIFHIKVNCGSEFSDIFYEAVEKTNTLMTAILRS